MASEGDIPGESDSDVEFVALFLKHQGAIYRYIASLLTNLNDAEEVFQHTSMILWKRREKVSSDEHFIRMAYTIALNEVRNTRRRTGRQAALLSESVLEALAASQPPSADKNEARRDALQSCIEKLSATAERLLRRYYRNYGQHDEIATELGISLPALRMKVHRVRRLLIECVERQLRSQEHPSELPLG